MMVAKIFFLFYLLYPSLSSAWCSGSIVRRSAAFSKAQLSKSYLTDRALLLHNTDSTTKTLESDEPGMAKAKMTLQKCFSSPDKEEAAANILQLVLFITVAGLMRLPSITSCTANAFRIFPHRQMLDYEPVSMINWIVHYSTVFINTGIFYRLVVRSSPSIRNNACTSRASSNIMTVPPSLVVPPSILNRKRKIYAIVHSGLGQLFGMGYMISHSLIGTRESMGAQQVLHNFSHFWMQVSAMSLGPMLLFPLSLGCVVSSLIVYFNLTGFLSLTNLPGIFLSNFSLLSVLVTPTEIFPRMFKIGHTMISLGFIPISILNSKMGGGTDLAHNLGAVWIATCMVLSKWSLDKNAKNNVVAPEENMGWWRATLGIRCGGDSA